MIYKKWKFPQVDKKMVTEVAEDCGLDPLLVFIAFARGLTDPYEIEQFVAKEPEFSDPYEYDGMSEAVERINIALESEEKILIFGDYDCDGVTATAMLTRYLRSRGADVSYRVPEREGDGYGISLSAVEEAANDGCTLIITVDNGINAVKEVIRANELGVDVVVTDHHLPLTELPDASAIVDPHAGERNEWIFNDLCGVGIVFKLICALDGRPCEEMIYEYADLTAIGTIADVVPLYGENRIIADIGTKMLNRRQNPGVRALAEIANAKYLCSGNVAFTICPRINAAGRMASAVAAVKLLLADNSDDAAYYAGQLDMLNSDRQAKERDVFSAAVEIIEKNGYDKDRVIVVDGFGWHIGVIGISASKLVEKYGKPCIVISTGCEHSTGSCRSITGFSVFEALSKCSDLLVKYGGHELAAGLTVNEKEIPELRRRINEYAAAKGSIFAEIVIDCKIKPRAFTVDAAKSVKAFEPYGAGNSAPLFAVTDSKITSIQPLSGGKHIRIRFRKENCDFNAVLFGTSPESFLYRLGDTVDIAVNLEVNTFKETESVSVIIKAIRKSIPDEEQVLDQLTCIEKLSDGTINSDEADRIMPGRNETAVVFRFLQSNPGVSRDFAETALMDTLPIGKVIVSIDALKELGLLDITDGVCNVRQSVKKVNLDDAEVLKRIKKIKEAAKGDL